MALSNLNELKGILIKRFEEHFNGEEIKLPSSFKTRVSTIFSDSVSYQQYTISITTRSGLKIYLPNQWVFIASYFTPFYKSLIEYKTIATTLFTNDQLKTLNGKELTDIEIQNIVDKGYSDDQDFITKFVSDYSWWGGGKTIERGDFYVSPILNMAKAVNASQSYIATLCEFLSENPDLSDNLISDFESIKKQKEKQVFQINNCNPKYLTYLTAIRTKPFILLAGISGTGKSRLVRELAYMSCHKIGKLHDQSTPGNYCMIEVKPNWHDSSELLGYTSGIKNKYVITPFVKFLVKAMRYPEVPFFVCLDEMNLAPVEQYFAEYLSILETRKMINNVIYTDSLIDKDIFIKYESTPSPNIFEDLGLKKEERTDLENEWENNTLIENELKEFGLRLPQNVIVVGTVNMDDTTHQFSRKVIDRAMTIEMNELNFDNMFSDKEKLDYIDNPIDAALFISDSVSANHALDFVADDAEKLKTSTINLMNELDGKLKDTPFRVAYRVQNELVLYFRNLRLVNTEKAFDELFAQAVDAILIMKVLPRIEGDEDLVEKPLESLRDWTENKYISSNSKIKEMLLRLKRSHYTSYWP